MPDWHEYRYILSLVQELIKQKGVFSSSVVEQGGIVDAIAKLSLGNKIGFMFRDISGDMFTPSLGDILLEVSHEIGEKYKQYVI